MMAFLLLLLVSVGFFAVCLLLMAVGVIIKNKTFKSCACSSMEYKGTKIECPGCTGSDGKPVGIR